MPRKPPKTYDVCRAQDGALVIRDVPLKTARAECARLCAEAKVHVRTVKVGDRMVEQYAGMYHGEIVRYEVRTPDGLVVPA